MAVDLKLGILTDTHYEYGATARNATVALAAKELGYTQVGCDLIWCLGDGIQEQLHTRAQNNEVRWEFSRKVLENASIAPDRFHAVQGNHDSEDEHHRKVFGGCNFATIISGVQFIAIDSTPKRLANYYDYTNSLNHEARHGMVEREALDFLDSHLAANPTVPTFVGMHHGIYPNAWGEGEAWVRYYENTSRSFPFSVGVGLLYSIVMNAPEVREILEYGSYNVVAVINGHDGHSAYTYVPQIPSNVHNGVTYITLRHGSWIQASAYWSQDMTYTWVPHLDIDTAAKTGEVLERNRTTHADDTTNKISLDWS